MSKDVLNLIYFVGHFSLYMALLDSFHNKFSLYWSGLLILALSACIFFGTVWYAVFPLNSYGNANITQNLINVTPFVVASMIFMAVGFHMTRAGKTHT